MSKLTIVCFLLLFSSCKDATKDKVIETNFPDKVVERYVKAGEYLKFRYYEDSVNLDTSCKEDATFLAVWFYDEQQSEIRRHYTFQNDTLGFTVPKNTSYMVALFYNLCDSEDESYLVHVVDNLGKAKPNTYYYDLGDTVFLRKELENHPDNLTAYSNHIVRLSERVYLGELDQLELQNQARKYLGQVQEKVSTEKVQALEALSILYAYSGYLKESERVINMIYDKFPYSRSLYNSYSRYSFAGSVSGVSQEQAVFKDSLVARVVRNYPQSPFGVLSIGGKNHHYYSDEDLLKSMKIALENGSPYGDKRTFIRQLIKLKKTEEAKKEAVKYIRDIEENVYIHNSPPSKKRKIIGAGKNTHLGWGYQLLAEVSQAKNKLDKAIHYLDTAYSYYLKDDQNQFVDYSINKALGLKSQLQKQLSRYDKALQTYETLYEETENPVVLDSIQVLFREMEQEKGFESYVEKLKKRVANNEQKQIKKLASDFAVKEMSGYEIKLSEWKDRTVVINFWANYCLPCAKEIPHLNKLWRSTQSEDIIFLAATKNTKLEVERFAQRQKEMFGFVILPEAQALFDAYEINLVPTTIVINQKGEIIHRMVGFSKNIDNLERVIKKELKY